MWNTLSIRYHQPSDPASFRTFIHVHLLLQAGAGVVVGGAVVGGAAVVVVVHAVTVIPHTAGSGVSGYAQLHGDEHPAVSSRHWPMPQGVYSQVHSEHRQLGLHGSRVVVCEQSRVVVVVGSPVVVGSDVVVVVVVVVVVQPGSGR